MTDLYKCEELYEYEKCQTLVPITELDDGTCHQCNSDTFTIERKYNMNYDLGNNFKSHKVDLGQNNKMQIIRDTAKNLSKLIGDICPESRELSLARTKLEEVMFWANAAIARNGK